MAGGQQWVQGSRGEQSLNDCGERRVPARLWSKAHWEVGKRSPDNSFCKGEGQPLQEGGEGKGEGVKEQHAPLLPEHWQPLTLHVVHILSAKQTMGL